jgi:hypothetical protein
VWAPSATYTDPTVADLGKVELLAHIAKVQATRPGARVRRTTVIDEHHGALRFGFTVVGADGAILGVLVVRSAQPPAVRSLDEKTLREYAGVYQREPNAFVYLQL